MWFSPYGAPLHFKINVRANLQPYGISYKNFGDGIYLAQFQHLPEKDCGNQITQENMNIFNRGIQFKPFLQVTN